VCSFGSLIHPFFYTSNSTHSPAVLASYAVHPYISAVLHLYPNFAFCHILRPYMPKVTSLYLSSWYFKLTASSSALFIRHLSTCKFNAFNYSINRQIVVRLPKRNTGTSSIYLGIWKNSSVSRPIANTNNNIGDKFWKKIG
jgi:hypothetical protein